jgi:hypothetical protein
MIRTMHSSILHAALAALTVGLCAQGAQAASLASSSPAGQAVTDYSVSGLASVDIDFTTGQPVTLAFEIDAAEAAAGSLSFSAVLNNLTGLNLPQAGFSLLAGGVTIVEPAGSVNGAFAPVVSTWWTPTSAGGVFDPDPSAGPDTGEGFQATLGNPLGQPGRVDFTLRLDGLSAGDQVSMVIAVPEPAEWAFMLAGLGAAAGIARRRRAATLRTA